MRGMALPYRDMCTNYDMHVSSLNGQINPFSNSDLENSITKNIQIYRKKILNVKN